MSSMSLIRFPRWVQALVAMAWLAEAQECRVVPLSPAQPSLKVEEGERAQESQTFQTGVFALSPGNIPYFFDTADRIRRIDPSGRMATVAGNGNRGETVTPGPATGTALPAVTQLAFSPEGVLHFTATGRVFRVAGGTIEVVAGSGKPGFNGETVSAIDVNLGAIVNIAFDASGSLLILDGYNRVRRLDPDGVVRTIAGSSRPASATGFTGDNRPATEASLSSPRQIVPLKDGGFWIKDLSGRHLRLVTPDGLIRTINQNFEPTVNIVLLANREPAAATANRLYPIQPNGAIETGARPFPPFTGTPLAVGSDGALFYLGSARPEQRNPLVRMAGGNHAVIAGAPVAATVDGQSPPFGVWHSRTNSLLYSTTQGGKSGIVAVRPGQSPTFVLGGGADVGEAEGKMATSLSIFGILAFSVDGEGRIIAADVVRRRLLVAGTDGRVSVLKTAGSEPVVYAPLGSLSNQQRIAADNAGNIYWFSQGATPTGGVFTAEVSVWSRATSSLSTFTVQGLAAIPRLEDGTVAVIAGNSANFRTPYRVDMGGQGDAVGGLSMLPLQSVARWRDRPYFSAASRLFRAEPGSIEMFLPEVTAGASFVPDYVLSSPDHLMVHLNDGGFYRIENIDACRWVRQPLISRGGVLNAASYDFGGAVSPLELITVFGSGLGPPEGQGIILNGVLRATSQPAPYPNLTLGNFSGAIPNATLTGTALPVVHATDTQMTVQVPPGVPASGEYRLYFTWQGLQLIYPEPLKVQSSTPGLFQAAGDTAAALLENGASHHASNPARAGSVVQFFGAGLGTMTVNLAAGEFLGAAELAPAIAGVGVTISGRSAGVEYAGGAPGMLGGVYQINVRVPEGLPAGPHAVIMTADGVEARPVTLWVR